MLDNASHIGIIGELNNEKIGVVFMEIYKESSKVSINLNPLHRGKRLSGILMRRSMLKVQKTFPQLQQFTAEIKNTNTASIKIFVQNGFTRHTKKPGSSFYRFQPKSLGVK